MAKRGHFGQLRMGERVSKVLVTGGAGLQPEVTGRFQKGDIRHCYPDISRIAGLGYVLRMSLAEGIADLAAWAAGQSVEGTREDVDGALSERGLLV